MRSRRYQLWRRHLRRVELWRFQLLTRVWESRAVLPLSLSDMDATAKPRHDLWDVLRTAVLDGGCAAVGVADAEPFDDVRVSIEDRKAAEMHGGMHFTFGDPARSTNIRRSFPWARSLVVGGYAYVPEAGSPAPPSANHGRVARFATEDHYIGLRSALAAGSTHLRSHGYEAEVVVDDNRLVDRAAAVRAGIAWWGKNAMVLSPASGPWMLLGSIVTNAALEPTPPMVRDCGTCSACLPACPTGALVAPGVLDARLCLAHLLQAKDWIPRSLRPAVGDRIYGCDDCLDACPPGSKLIRIAPPKPRLDVLALLALGDDELLEKFAHFYVPRRRAVYLRRNMLVALGNSGDRRAIAVLEAYLKGDEPMLRAHAAWALGRLQGSGDALQNALDAEVDEAVREEIVAALGAEA